MMRYLKANWRKTARFWRSGVLDVFLLVPLLASSFAFAEPRLFLPVFSEPVPADIEREFHILSGSSGASLDVFLAGRSVASAGMEASGERLFAAIAESPGGLAVVEVRTGLLRTIDIPLVFPNVLAFDYARGRLLIGGNTEPIIAEIDLTSLQLANVIELSGPATGVSGIAVDPNRGRLHLIRASMLETIDATTSEVIQQVPSQSTSAARDILRFDALRDRLYFSGGFRFLQVFNVTDEGLIPYATVEFERSFRSFFMDEQGGRLYAGATTTSQDEGTYSIDVDSIPPGNVTSAEVDMQFLSLPRGAPYMDLDRDNGILYLVQDYHVTPNLPPRPPGDPMSIFAVDPVNLEIQQTFETEVGGPGVPVDGFLTRIAGPSGPVAASVPALNGPGLLFLLTILGVVGLSAASRRV